MAAMIKFKNVTKSFGKIQAIQNVSFEVDKGDFVFITGSSGAGKTTLLRMILREMLPDSGEILIGGKDVTKLHPKDIPLLRQQIGVVFQDFKVLPERTVRENIEVACAVIGLPEDEWKKRVKHVLKLVGLEERYYLFPSQLSGGELQRVSLARALVVNPKIVLADEPTGNLDWETAEELMDLFENINKEGKTIIMATHHKLIVDKHREIVSKSSSSDGKSAKLNRQVIVLENGKVVEKTNAKKQKGANKKRVRVKVEEKE